jgi:uncharacterized membrane protein YdjX (TVP38/TMEM64 family)
LACYASPVWCAVQNYLFGLTRIRLLPFTLAMFFFTIPQVTLYVCLGAEEAVPSLTISHRCSAAF